MSEEELAALVVLHRDATMGRLLPALLHELRNPLNSIGSSAQLLAEKGADEALRGTLVPVLRRCSGAMKETMDAVDLNQLVAQESGRLDLHQTLASCMKVLSSATRYLDYHPVGVKDAAWVQGNSETIWTALLSTLETCTRSRAKNLWVCSKQERDWQVLVIEHDGEAASAETSKQAQEMTLALELSRILLSRDDDGDLSWSAREPQGDRVTLRVRRLASSSNEQNPLRR